jgi:hypothetical protein
MINAFKYMAIIGIAAAIVWFEMRPEFAAVLLGILSLSVFMLTFLPIASDKKI